MDDEWCSEQLKNLHIRENRLGTLNEIRVRLNGSPTLEAIVTNRLLSAPEIYECLDEAEQFEVATDILSICMAKLSISQNEIPRLLQRALTHGRAQIQALALHAILKTLQQQHPNLDVSNELLMHVMRALQHEATEVGAPAMNILTLVLERQLEEERVRSALLDMLKQNEVIRCRVYELAVKLVRTSPTALPKVEFLLNRAALELEKDDVLFQVNLLEIFASLAEDNRGLVFLEKRQTFEILNKRVEELDENPMDRLLVPGIMKFFGKIAATQPQKVIEGFPHMVLCLFECFESENVSILPTVFDTLANLTNTQNGHLLMEKHYATEMTRIMKGYGHFLRNMSVDIKKRALNTLEAIFTTERNVPQEVSDVLYRWFMCLAGGTNMQFLVGHCQNPFPDIKTACLGFVKAVCAYKWGVEALKETGGFLEFLLDRKMEFNKDAKLAKYELIEVLAASGAYDAQIQLQLERYINEGPFYVQPSMEVAVEGE